MPDSRELAPAVACGGAGWWGHLLAWLGGALVALTPFVRDWSIGWGGLAVPVRVWPGNFMVGLAVAAVLAVCGAVAGGTWWLAARRAATRLRLAAAVFALGLGAFGCTGLVSKPVFGCLVLPVLAGWVLIMVKGRRGGGMAGQAWHDPPMNWSTLVFPAVLALAVVGDCVVLAKHSATGTAAFAFVLSRLLTNLTLLAVGWWLLLLLKSRSPRGLRWTADFAVWGVLVCLLAELGMSRLWGKSLAVFFSEFAVDGKLDLATLMDGGNVEVGPGGWLAIGAALLAVAGVQRALGRLSRLFGPCIRPSRLLLLAGGSWLALVVEQASELLWNDRAGRWLQRRSLLVHLSPFPARPGMAAFGVEFRDFPRPSGEGATRRPDVFLFIVETLRQDAIRPEITPFLADWARSECQVIHHSRSASNATHLSWFTMLGGRPALLWDQDRRIIRPAPMLEVLKGLGYRTEVRSAAAYDYMQMETTNFGRGEATDFMMNKRVNPGTWPRGSSACDLHVLRHWQEALPKLPASPVFQINDIESPHYPYYWLETATFTPPHADYFRSANFPFMPGRETIRLVRNRYENSVAFVDHLLESYVSGLRQAGRYDDALIIVTGDHGDELQENGFWFHTTGLTPQQTAVPLLIKWPRAMGRGSPVTDAGHTDILPSVLQALGCPPEQWSGMAGRPLHDGGDATTLVTTYYASQNGEGMVWRRAGYEAAFGWRQIWVHQRPGTVWLERLSGPAGAIHASDSAAAAALLRRHFPDATARWFARFELLDF